MNKQHAKADTTASKKLHDDRAQNQMFDSWIWQGALRAIGRPASAAFVVSREKNGHGRAAETPITPCTESAGGTNGRVRENFHRNSVTRFNEQPVRSISFAAFLRRRGRAPHCLPPRVRLKDDRTIVRITYARHADTREWWPISLKQLI